MATVQLQMKIPERAGPASAQSPPVRNGYKTISLTQGKYAIVDDADFEWLNQWKWYAHKVRNTFYAVRISPGSRGKQKTILMHREILGLKPGDKRKSDHRNHHGLDNRQDNLRFATTAQNQYNQNKYKNNSSVFKGISWHKRSHKWQARIQIDGRQKYLGSFYSKIEAARAYDAAAEKYFGEFACTNF